MNTGDTYPAVNPEPAINLDRRDALRLANATALSLAASTLPINMAAAQTGSTPAGNRDAAPLGARLQGVQHFGVTVQNMDRAFEFYTEVLGGTEVMRDGDFHGERIHYTLLTDEEIIANERRSTRERSPFPISPAGRSGSTCASSSSTTW